MGIDLNSDNIEFKLEQAFRFKEEGKYLHAIQIYEPLLNEPKFCRDAVLHLSDIYESLNKVDKAERILVDYVDAIEDVELSKHLCHLLLRHDKYEQVLDILEKVSFDENPEVYFLAGYANFYLSDYDLAINQFSQFLRIVDASDLHADAYLFLAKSYLSVNRFDDAQNSAEKALELFSGNPDVFLILAIIFYHKEMFLHAFEKIRKAISINEKDPEYLKWAAKILIKLEEFDKAIVYLTTYLEIDDPDTEGLNLIAQTYFMLNNFEDSIKFYQKSLELNPNDENALSGLEKLKK